jgi:hypothetical protein
LEQLLWWKRSVGERVGMRVLLLTVAIALAAIAATPIGLMRSGEMGAACVWLAAVVCGLPGVAAVLVQAKCRDPQLLVLHVLVGFFVRLGVPLAVCMIIYLQGGPLVEAGFAGYLLGLYLVALAAGTLLDLAQHESAGVQRLESPQ